MSLKMKLTSTICAFFLILGLMVMGVFASSTAKIELGGNLSFTATNVHAQVDGAISGVDTPPELKTLLFKEGRTDGEQATFTTNYATWTDCDLTFKSTGDAISIVITIKNLADRPLYAIVNPASKMSSGVASSMLTVASVDATEGTIYNAGDVITLGNVGSQTAIAYVRLTMTLNNKNASLASNAEWGYDIDLLNEAPEVEEVLDASTYTTLVFSYENEENRTLLVKANEEEMPTGDLVIPSKVIYEGKECTVVGTATGGTPPENGFYGCELDSVSLPKTFKYINSSAFCDSTLTSVVIPEGVEYIGGMAFNCPLTSVVLPSTIKYIDSEAFHEGVITAEDEYIRYLKNYNENGEVVNEKYVLLSAMGITDETYEVADGCKIIASGAIQSCPGLKTLIIPTSVNLICDNAISNSSEFANIYYRGTQEQWGQINIVSNNETLLGATMTYNYSL